MQGITCMHCDYYFNSLFSSSNLSQSLDEVLSFVEPKVKDNMNNTILVPFSADEVKKALFDMHPSKARPYFFRKHGRGLETI